MKERNVSLENDLMLLGQEPMDEPNSSTTIELRQVERRAGKTAPSTEPPKPPTSNRRKADVPQGDRSLGQPTENSAPETFGPGIRPTEPAHRGTDGVRGNPYAPVRYGCDGAWRPVLAVVAIVCLAVAVVEALTGLRAHWKPVVAFVLAAFAMWPLHGWLDELERDMAVKAVASEYGLTVIRVMGCGGSCAVRYVYGAKPEIREASVDYAQGFAWLKTSDGGRMIGRCNPLA